MGERIFWWNTSFGEDEKQEAIHAIDSNYLNEGPKTREMEKQFSDFLSIPYVNAVPNGTIALATSLWAVGIQPGDEVILPDLTFIATMHAVSMVGAKPVLADIDPNNYNLSPDDVKRKINERTKAIILVHINGRACDIEAFKDIKKSHPQLSIVEDCAQSLGSFHKDTSMGAFFDAASISLAPSKVISTGQGGLVLSNSEKVDEQIKRLKDHGRMARTEMMHPQVGFNLKFTDLQAGIGLAQLKKLPERLKKAKQDREQYNRGLSDLQQLQILPYQNEEVPLWIDFVSDDRINLEKYFSELNIELRPFWDCMHRQWIGGKDEEFPVSSKIADTGFWLPSGPDCPPKSIDKVIDALRSFYK